MNSIAEDNISEGINNEVDILMKNIKDTNDLYFVALIIMSKLKDSNKYGMLSELSYLIDTQSFMNLLFYFEGMTITIPTREELREALQIISIYYYYNIKEMTMKDSMIATGIVYDKSKEREMWKKYKKFSKELEDVKFPRMLRMPRMDDKLRMDGVE